MTLAVAGMTKWGKMEAAVFNKSEMLSRIIGCRARKLVRLEFSHARGYRFQIGIFQDQPFSGQIVPVFFQLSVFGLLGLL
jgi:hypothetical protein